MRQKVIYHGHGSYKVKLGGKYRICVIFWKKYKSNYNQTSFVDTTCEPLLSEWVGVVLS